MKTALSVLFLAIMPSVISAQGINSLRKSAEQGYSNAQFALGQAYVNGDRVTVGPTEGTRGLRKAADQSNADAQSYLEAATDHHATRQSEAGDFPKTQTTAQSPELQEAQRLNDRAVELYQAGQYDEALSLCQQSLAIREKTLGAEHPDVAASLNNLAVLYKAKGDYGKAEPLFQRSLAIREKTLGAEHPDLANPLNNLATLYQAKGDYGKAELLYQRALAILEKALGADHPKVATPLNNLAVLYMARGNYAKAEPLYQRSLLIYEKALGGQHPAIATSLNNLAELYRAKGDYGKAEPLYQRSLAILEKALGAEHPAVATSLNNLAALYMAKGDYAKAEPLYERCLVIAEKTLGADHPDVATSLNNLAALHMARGDYAKAEPLYQRSLAIREKALGAEHPDVATSLNNLALLYREEGDYAKAEPLYQRSLLIYEKALGAEHPDVAASLNNLAELYQVKGDYVKAEPLFQRSLAIREKALGAEHPDVAAALNNLALLYMAKGDYAKAEPLYQRSLLIYEKALGAEHPDVAQSLNNLATLYQAKGDYGIAELLYQRSLAIREKALGAEHPDVAQSLNNLALLYIAKGDYAKAEPLCQRSLAILERALGAEHPDVATALDNLSALYDAKGDIKNAVATFVRALEVRERNIQLILDAGSQRQKRLYLDTLKGETSSIVSLNINDAPKEPTAARLALTTILRRKGRALDVMTDQIGALRRHASAEDQKLLDQLADARAQLANLQLTQENRTLRLRGEKNTVSPEARPALISKLEEEIEKLEGDVSRRSAEFRAETQRVTIERVQAALPADATLVELFSYRPFNAKSRRYGTLFYVAYVLKSQDEPQFVELGEAAAIDANVEKLRVALRDAQRAKAADDSAVRQPARDLDEQVMRPVRRLLGPTKRIFLSPDGALNLIPFAALVDENGKYLVENYSITYLTSGRDLLRLQVSGESKDPPTVLANPLFDTRKRGATAALTETAKRGAEYRSLDFTTLLYPPLPGTAAEAKELATLFPGTRLLTEAQATEAAVKGLSHPWILHISTHGFFLSDQPREVPQGRRDLFHEEQVNAAVLQAENPLLRSGLILAGVNQRSSGGNEDGVLTALETSALDLFGTKLVVLSACETGLGEVLDGDGVYGLRRALVLAGSETQVMSLWKVSDEGTRELMVDYYQRLVAGEGRGEALRQVQLEMFKSPTRRHPFFWASFIVSGNWTKLDLAKKTP